MPIYFLINVDERKGVKHLMSHWEIQEIFVATVASTINIHSTSPLRYESRYYIGGQYRQKSLIYISRLGFLFFELNLRGRYNEVESTT